MEYPVFLTDKVTGEFSLTRGGDRQVEFCSPEQGIYWLLGEELTKVEFPKIKHYLYDKYFVLRQLLPELSLGSCIHRQYLINYITYQSILWSKSGHNGAITYLCHCHTYNEPQPKGRLECKEEDDLTVQAKTKRKALCGRCFYYLKSLR